MARVRRVRGILLRLVGNRPAAMIAGAALGVPAIWLLARDYAWESGLSDGVVMLSLATGAALVWNGVSGRRPDWLDPDA